MEQIIATSSLAEAYKNVRLATIRICEPLETEDYVVQPIADVSPPKWHLGHTTWFFETFILKPYMSGYQEYDKDYNFVFNSYYETVGNRVIRTDRGNLSRPTVKAIYRYRHYVDDAMQELLGGASDNSTIRELVILGINHEQQHQELLWTDIKYILGHNPLFPAYAEQYLSPVRQVDGNGNFAEFKEGVYEIGYKGKGFSWDNEHAVHKVYLNAFKIHTTVVTNREYLEFMNSKGYGDFRHWHSDGWAWVQQHKAAAPLYWHFIDGLWLNYTLRGLEKIDPNAPVCHVNYYEASAYASWRGLRLPTEFEWEVAAAKLNWGQRWEWTASAYLPYPGFETAPGALGEYNGKFMVNQQVLRGASEVTPEGHSRPTYRNFFQPNLQWQFTGIRLAN